MIVKACQKFTGPLGDVTQAEKKVKRRQECLLRDLATALIICNNVTPVEDNGVRVLQASSPDEIALVKFSEGLGFMMREREKAEITIRTPIDSLEKYDILANFPFSS
jgi:phospholipid-translocating ATPase